MKSYDISVVVPIFNPSWKGLRATLKSILLQEDVLFQIVIADDASAEDITGLIKDFFVKNDFEDYKLIRHENNVGTVNNILSAVKCCDGKYVRDIGQGDVLFSRKTLKNLLLFAEKENADVVLSEAVSFVIRNQNIEIISSLANPQNIEMFSDKEKLRRNYILYSDVGNGATTFYKKDIYLKYLTEGAGCIRFAEDQLIKLMILDEYNIRYLAEATVFYEYSNGISNNGMQLLQIDSRKLEQLIMKRVTDELFYKKMRKVITSRNRFFEKHSLVNNLKWTFSDIGVFLYRLKLKLKPRKTKKDAPTDFLKMCLEKGE